MKKTTIIVFFVIMCLSCVKQPDTKDNSYVGNFDALWEIMDTRYCYFDYKEINWNQVYDNYLPRARSVSSERELFDLMSNMLAELKDGHVNLTSPFDVSRYNQWYTSYPANFNANIVRLPRYLGDRYKIAGGMLYNKIADEEIGYIYYGSFSDGFSDQNMKYILDYFAFCEGLIIDVRNNGGGNINYAEKLTSYFLTESKITGYITHKTGPGHSDFSELLPVYTHPHSSILWNKKVVVLTNRRSYSATNDFVNQMKLVESAVIIGDITGGGGGMPLSSELPNGWNVRFSAAPMFDANKRHIEFGIEPDIKIDMDTLDNSRDAIIEKAIEVIRY